MLDKTILNELVNENVSTETQLKNSKTPEKSITLAFFFVLNLDEQLDER